MQTLRKGICEPPAGWSRTSSCVLVALIAILTGVRSASAQTATRLDPSGDAEYSAPGFQDMIRVEVTKEGDEFVVRMDVAAAIPLNPPLPPPAVHEIWWAWAFQLDPTTAPAGYPIAPGATLPSEVHAHIGWDGTSFHGIVIDRKPLLNGEPATILTVPFSVQGATMELRVPAAVLGNVASFGLTGLTMDWSGPVGTGGFHFVDQTSRPAVTWP